MIVVRQVTGTSMLPALRPGRVVVAWRWPRRIVAGDIVIVRHEGLEKIKRVQQLAADKLFVVGDNAAASTDSRHFGWLDRQAVVGRVWQPGHWRRQAARR